MCRWLSIAVMCVMVLSVGVASAQGDPPRLVQADDGTLYIVAQGQRWLITPSPIAADALGAIPDAGSLADGVITLGSDAPAVAAPQPPAASGIGQQTITTSQNDRILITVNAVTDPARSTNQFNNAKGRWVLVDYTVENVGTSPYTFNPLALKLQSAEAFLFDLGNHAGHKEPNLSVGALGPGQKVRGFLAYDVPPDQRITAIVFQYFGTPQVVIAQI